MVPLNRPSGSKAQSPSLTVQQSGELDSAMNDILNAQVQQSTQSSQGAPVMDTIDLDDSSDDFPASQRQTITKEEFESVIDQAYSDHPRVDQPGRMS